MFHPDFSKYRGNEQGNCYYIGWLGSEGPFTTGEVSPEWLAKLKNIYEREVIALVRSIHKCMLRPCIFSSKEPGEIGAGSPSCELWIPNEDRSKIFITTNFIFHYINTHSYLPPEEFIRAVDKFDLTSSWSGKEERARFFANFKTFI